MEHWTGNKSVNVCGPKDRLLRYLMVNTSNSIGSLVSTFGQNKSVIYADYKFIALGIVKVMGGEWVIMEVMEVMIDVVIDVVMKVVMEGDFQQELT